MNNYESFFIWAAIYTYIPAFALLLGAAVFRRDWSRSGFGLTGIAFLSHTVSMVVRWAAAGHPPVQGNYENALLGSWFLVVIYLIGGYKDPRLRPAGIIAVPLALLILGVGLRTPTLIEPLSAPYQSNWLWVHVGFSWLAFGAFLLAACLGGYYFLKSKKAPESDLMGLEEIILGFLLFGFVAQAFMIATGAVWAANLWGRYWSWDPIETWSLVCWLVYGLILHLRLTMGWRGRRLAALAVLAALTVVISFWGLGIGQGVHTPLL